MYVYMYAWFYKRMAAFICTAALVLNIWEFQLQQ